MKLDIIIKYCFSKSEIKDLTLWSLLIAYTFLPSVALSSVWRGQALIKSCHLIEPAISSPWSVVRVQTISYRQPTTVH
jgi:hypothetical protein